MAERRRQQAVVEAALTGVGVLQEGDEHQPGVDDEVRDACGWGGVEGAAGVEQGACMQRAACWGSHPRNIACTQGLLLRAPVACRCT